MTEKEILDEILSIDIKDAKTSFNILNLMYSGVNQKEVTQSKILAGLLNPNENHEFGILLLESFLKEIGVQNLNLHADLTVELERKVESSMYDSTRRIDIFISWKDNNSVTKKHAVIIENKLHGAPNQAEQLRDYHNAIAKEYYEVEKLVYMPLSSKVQHSKYIDLGEDEEKIRRKIEDFDAEKLVKWLDAFVKNNKEHKNIHIVNQYKEFLNCLISNQYYMDKIIEIQGKLSVEDINKLEVIAQLVNSEGWTIVRFKDIVEKIEPTFGGQLKIKYKRHTDRRKRNYAQFYFEQYKYWVELWLNKNDIELWLVSQEKYGESEKVATYLFQYWGKGENGYHYYQPDNNLKFGYIKENKELCDVLISILEELKNYKKEQ